MVEIPAPANRPSERSGTLLAACAPVGLARTSMPSSVASRSRLRGALRADSETTLRSTSRRSVTPRSSRRNVSAPACEESSAYS